MSHREEGSFSFHWSWLPHSRPLPPELDRSHENHTEPLGPRCPSRAPSTFQLLLWGLSFRHVDFGRHHQATAKDDIKLMVHFIIDVVFE